MPSLVPGAAHDFKMSVCEIIYSPEKEAFDVKFYLFQDDLKAAVYGNPLAEIVEAGAVSAYILKHFYLGLDGQQQTLSYHSLREKNDQVLVQFTTPKISPKTKASITVKSTLLTEKFRDQINMVYLIFPEKSNKTQMLNATKTEGSFSF